MVIMSLILFDFDGVLADTLDDLLQFGQQACDALGVTHTATQADLDALEVMSFATYGLQMGVPESLVDDFVRICIDKFNHKETPPAMFEGLADVIRKLSEKHDIAVITGNASQTVQAFLTAHRLERHVRAIFGLDMPGSKVAKIEQARASFTAGNETVWMVGDSTSDIRAAKEAAVKSIAVSWGHQSVERLSRAGPDYLVHSPEELLALFTKADVPAT
ncbi:MAG: HAD family hydrolase [Anaerolineales bacterium]